jgi:hypothetical protein
MLVFPSTGIIARGNVTKITWEKMKDPTNNNFHIKFHTAVILNVPKV